MTWIMTARDLLSDTLRGQVFAEGHKRAMQPYPPVPGAVALPSAWIGGHVGSIADGQAVVTFAVYGIVDGENEAQQAMIDAMLAAAVSACQAVRGLRPVRWRTQIVTISGTNPAEQYPGFVLEVNVTVPNHTFVAPVPVPATIPITSYSEV